MMRSATAVTMLVVCLLGAGGVAGADPGAAGTALSADHYGVLAGSVDAPVQLEFFCDPQCPECAKFEAESGENVERHLGSGQLAVTYRWLTFLDAKRDNDTSARVGNALMAAVDPATSATAYQAFVSEVYRHQHPRGEGTAVGDLAGMATESGVPGWVVVRIAAGVPSVDTAAMNTANRDRLKQASPENPGTPTVYDLKTNTVVDTADPNWLERLLPAG